MDCAGCLKKNRIEFEKKTCLFEDRHHLAVFLLNETLNIQYEETSFCRCKRYEICLVCQAKTYYQNYQYKIFEHSLHFNFLAKLRENLYRNMLKLLTLDNHFVELSIKKTNLFIVIGSLERKFFSAFRINQLDIRLLASDNKTTFTFSLSKRLKCQLLPDCPITITLLRVW